jgi:hypothetical protein
VVTKTPLKKMRGRSAPSQPKADVPLESAERLRGIVAALQSSHPLTRAKRQQISEQISETILALDAVPLDSNGGRPVNENLRILAYVVHTLHVNFGASVKAAAIAVMPDADPGEIEALKAYLRRMKRESKLGEMSFQAADDGDVWIQRVGDYGRPDDLLFEAIARLPLRKKRT